MKAIFNKEIQSFFSNPVGYLLVISFLLLNGLILWVFKGSSNVFYSGFADINAFFSNSSWILAVLIPAMTMKSFADEYNNGTIEILKTLPVSHTHIVLAKFWAFMVVIFITLTPSLVFVYSTYQLGNPIGNIDLGSTLTSYFGLALLASTYIGIGLFSSIVMLNNVSAFILSTIINFTLYFGFTAIENVSEITSSGWGNFGITPHFEGMTRGVIDSTDLIYFISLTLAFLVWTKIKLDHV
ncbi:MAG: ABC transporter permease subunit [Wenyingzhuangia sp.]|uniref:ABC transporter permease subunit n=1 Tax=Wenyingzhuangia sp. TaxID=1964193 RepID=UPI00321AB083